MEIIVLILLLTIAAEATYLTVVSTGKIYRNRYQKPILVDTSVLIDSRIVSVARTGFLKGKVLIPRSVVGELQLLADGSDSEKRSRARHGLDVISELQLIPNLDIEILQDSNKADEGVDNRLLKLAKQYNGTICTIDYNLNKVAKVESIEVLNVNDLAMSLRMAYLPGEKLNLELTNKGQDSHQAVGHIADGTMVVVENGSSKIGQTVEVEFIRSLQTAAGKMMFAKIVDNNHHTDRQKSKPNDKPAARQNNRNVGSQAKRQPRYNGKSNNRFVNKASRSEQNIVDLANK
jgi:uncharacterized protein YacL